MKTKTARIYRIISNKREYKEIEVTQFESIIEARQMISSNELLEFINSMWLLKQTQIAQKQWKVWDKKRGEA